MGSFLTKHRPHSSSTASAATATAAARSCPSGGVRGQITSKDKAVLDLKNARDRLRRYQTRLDIEAKQLHDSAKTLLQCGKRVR